MVDIDVTTRDRVIGSFAVLLHAMETTDGSSMHLFLSPGEARRAASDMQHVLQTRQHVPRAQAQVMSLQLSNALMATNTRTLSGFATAPRPDTIAVMRLSIKSLDALRTTVGPCCRAIFVAAHTNALLVTTSSVTILDPDTTSPGAPIVRALQHCPLGVARRVLVSCLPSCFAFGAPVHGLCTANAALAALVVLANWRTIWGSDDTHPADVAQTHLTRILAWMHDNQHWLARVMGTI